MPTRSSSPTRMSTSSTASRSATRCRRPGCEVDILSSMPGEQSKSPDVAADLWEQLLDQGADRKSVVVALGGGVVGDLAGFVAATFARGLRFVQVPTTLLAQVDSSVGGKVGINLPGGKNMVGAFWQPRGVLIDVDVLESLPEREYRAGLAEVVKYGVIQDAEFFAYLEANVDDDQQPRCRRADAHRRALLPAEGRRRRAGRTRRDGPAVDPQLRPHVLPRLRSGHRLRGAAARRRRGDRHDVRRAAGRAAGPRRCGVRRAAAEAARSVSACRSMCRTSSTTN